MLVGEPRSGKSYSALRIAELVDNDFTLDRLVYSPSEFLELVINSKEGDVIVFDEAGVNIFSREWQSKMNKALAKVFQILGYKHLGIILTFPSVMFVDKAIRRLFNYILLARGFDREKEISFCKAYCNLPTNYVLGTEILAPFSIRDDDSGQKVDASDLVFRRPKLADEYEEYAKQRKDELLLELKQDILELIGGDGNQTVKTPDIAVGFEIGITEKGIAKLREMGFSEYKLLDSIFRKAIELVPQELQKDVKASIFMSSNNTSKRRV
jgi:hypothetical protein